MTVVAVATAVAAAPSAVWASAVVHRRGGARGLLPGGAGRVRREQARTRTRVLRSLETLRRLGRRAGPREHLVVRRLVKDVRVYLRQVPLDEQDLGVLAVRLELLAEGLPLHVAARRAPHQVSDGPQVRRAWTGLLDATAEEAAALHRSRSRAAVAGLIGAAEALALERGDEVTAALDEARRLDGRRPDGRRDVGPRAGRPRTDA
ncbi:hypothetical protein [Cellulomonas marina]|uniref:Uncharacterized protein n=2 Tax=Cellulomonas marina TaxID=988821 RepID=A0A1I0Y1P8_9CELL|nr:hypothetical protein [Cellulomonas marina]SFB06576.1 hypothetical protein SAMN05421867_10693 [Cellulomonas marina]